MDDPAGMVKNLLLNLLNQVPVILAAVVGMILAVVFWGSGPRRSLFALLGLGLMLLWSFVSATVDVVLPRVLMASDVDPENWGTIFLGVGVCSSFVRAGGFALLIPALFGRRPAAGLAPAEAEEE